MNWRDFLSVEEIARIAEIDKIRAAATAERKRIWDRCRKRMRNAKS